MAKSFTKVSDPVWRRRLYGARSGGFWLAYNLEQGNYDASVTNEDWFMYQFQDRMH